MKLLEEIAKMRSLIKEDTYTPKCHKCGAEQEKSATHCSREKCGARLKATNEEIDLTNEGWKETARNGVMAGAMAIGGMMGGNSASAQTNQATKPAVTQTVTQGGVLAGNAAMDHNNLDVKALAKYKQINPSFWVKDSNDIKKVQAEILKYREFRIEQFKAKKPGQAGQEFPEHNETYSNFMPNVLKTGIDGINGQFTSQFVFPGSYMNLKDNGKIISTSNTGLAGNGGYDLKSLSIDQMNQWNKYTQWLKSTSINDL